MERVSKLTNLRKIQDSHIAFMMRMLGTMSRRPFQIHEMLMSAEAGAEHGFEPIDDITQARVTEVLRELRQNRAAEIVELQTTYMADFSVLPLAYKKHRVEQLADMYASVDTMTKGFKGRKENAIPLTDEKKVFIKRQLLRDIKDEIGEDIEKMAAALRDSGSTFIQVNLNQKQRAELAFVLTEDTMEPISLPGGTRPDGPTNGGAN